MDDSLKFPNPLIVPALIAVLFVYAYSLVILMNKAHHKLKIVSDDEVVKYIGDHKIEIKKLILFGYSCSFSKYLCTHFEHSDHKYTEITIIVPDDNFIRQNISDFISNNIETRVDVLKSRLDAWHKLKLENRIKNISFYRTNSLPFDYGYIINDELLLIGHYVWNCDNKKYYYEHMQYEKRFLMIVDKKTYPELFEYFFDKVKFNMISC